MAGLTSSFSVGQMQMTDYQNKQAKLSGTNNNTTTQEPIKDHTPDPNGTASAPNDTIGGGIGDDEIIAHGCKGDDVLEPGESEPKDILDDLMSTSTTYSVAQMQMTDYQNAQEIAESIPQMDMNDYLELKDQMPTEGAGGLSSMYSVGRMQMVDYQNAESLYRMADSGLIDEGALQEMLDSGEFEGTIYAQVAQQILDGDTEGLESWGFKDARDLQAPNVDELPSGGGGGMTTVFSVGKMQMVDYQSAQDLERLARNGLLDVDALQERYDEGSLSRTSLIVAANILNGEEE